MTRCKLCGVRVEVIVSKYCEDCEETIDRMKVVSDQVMQRQEDEKTIWDGVKARQ